MARRGMGCDGLFPWVAGPIAGLLLAGIEVAVEYLLWATPFLGSASCPQLQLEWGQHPYLKARSSPAVLQPHPPSNVTLSLLFPLNILAGLLHANKTALGTCPAHHCFGLHSDFRYPMQHLWLFAGWLTCQAPKIWGWGRKANNTALV